MRALVEQTKDYNKRPCTVVKAATSGTGRLGESTWRDLLDYRDLLETALDVRNLDV
ncbi:MAG: hypothetical protein U0Q16_28435 [Bryobacteraceae bacterium]